MVRGAVPEPAAWTHAMRDVAGAQADALDGGALWAGWPAAVLAQPEGALAAAAAGPEEATLEKMPTAGVLHAPTMRPDQRRPTRGCGPGRILRLANGQPGRHLLAGTIA
jgi:hypothetical protein